MKRTLFSLALLCLAFHFSVSAQDKKKWDVANPPGAYKEVEFNTAEGTWMNLDVSPDGKDIVFDMLGDIYTMPISGGEATLLQGGMPFEVQPRYSPDGKKICYTSDRGGGDNIWVMNRDGSSPKQITKEDFRLLNNAVWTPDGQYLITRKHFTATRSLGAGEIWMYHISGGDGLQLTARKNDQQDAGEPCMSPDGRYVYYSEDMYPGGSFQYNKDANNQIYIIRKYDREKGTISDVVTGPGGSFRPQISHDGKLLAFIRRVDTLSVLYIHNLATGEEWPLYDKLSKDQQEAWCIFGVYSNYNWTPDDKSIIIWAKGKIWKIDANTGSATEIPFKIHVKQRIQNALRFRQDVSPDKFEVKTIREAVTSPDDKLLVFNAVGYLWKKELPNGKPEKLTKGTDFEFEPAFSPDGKKLVYVTWNDEQTGSINILQLGKSNPVKITTEKGIYRTPSFSADGSKIVFRKEAGNDAQGFAYCVNPGIYWMNSVGGDMHLITSEGEEPQFNKTGDRIYYQTGGYLFADLAKSWKSINLQGFDEQTIFTSKYANRFVLSPDNKWVMYNELFKVYLAPLPESGKPIELSATTKSIPVSLLTRDAGINLHWSGDSRKIHWTLGPEYFTNEIKNRFTFLEGSPDSVGAVDTVGIDIGLVLNTDKPSGKIAFKGATIITMRGDEVIKNGTIITDGNRILNVGHAESTPIPADAKVMDETGKTIMPGFVDVHAHLGTFRYGLSPQKQWQYFANLAYGVTTTHDPSSNTEMCFSQSEMVKSGNMIGPRIFSTGIILYGADGDFKAVINSLDDAKSALRRTKAFGAFSVKSYNQPRRDQRQQVIEAARQLKMEVVPEGGSFFFHNMSMILDGQTGIEHNIPIATLYNDVVQLWKNSETGYTPTLIVCYGATFGENYWYQHTNVFEKERLLKFTPRAVIDTRARHRTMIPEDEYEWGHIQVSKSVTKLEDAGVKVNLGAHGQLQGLGAHWELWNLSLGGMSNMQALHCATINGAHYLGLDHDLGSLDTGKLADLIILDKNPLDDIHNSESVRYTMVNGRLYDCETMNEVGNADNQRTKFYWELGKNQSNFPWHETTVGNEGD